MWLNAFACVCTAFVSIIWNVYKCTAVSHDTMARRGQVLLDSIAFFLILKSDRRKLLKFIVYDYLINWERKRNSAKPLNYCYDFYLFPSIIVVLVVVGLVFFLLWETLWSFFVIFKIYRSCVFMRWLLLQ